MVRRRDDDDDEDDRPRRRRRERDDDDLEGERPRRAKKKGKSRLGLWIGLGVGGVALIGLIILMIVLFSSGGGAAAKANFVGKWEKIDPKGPGEPFVEFTADGVFRMGGQDSMTQFGGYTVSGKTATATSSKTTNFSRQGERIMTVRATLTGDDELSATHSKATDKYRRIK